MSSSFSSSDLNQAVTVTLDPPLRISNCHCWQLLRNHYSEIELQDKKYYTIEDSENLAFHEGFVLVAMNADGSKYFPDDCIKNNTTKNNDDDQDSQEKSDTSNVEFYFAAPNPNIFDREGDDEKRTPLVLTKPLMKNAVVLVPHYHYACDDEHNHSPQKNLFSWNVTRFPGGGISFHTTLEKVAAWFKSLENKKIKNDAKNAEPIGYYLTDDARLLSEELIEGPVGFGMNLAYPPVVDVTCLLDRKQRQESNESETTLIRSIERTRRFLVDAAGDCGFFYSVICQKTSSSVVDAGFELNNNNNRADFISSNDAHSASQRLMQIIRNVFGRSISAKKKQELASSPSPCSNPHFNNCFPIDEQLTKVTLKSTTGEVKTSFNPPRFVKIELPEWMQNICDENETNENMKLVEKCCQEFFENEFIPAHFTKNVESRISSSQETEENENNNNNDIISSSSRRSDLETHFSFGEELAARIIGMLLQSADAKISTQWPTKEMIENHPKMYESIQVTNIREGAVKIRISNAATSVNVSVSIPRVEPSELYTLFRSVCYPPSTRTHDKKKKKLEQLVASSSAKTENEDDEENVDYVYEEVEEEMEVENDDARSSHKSSDTDDSQGKALYEHTDKTWITLLIASPSLHGLEVVDIDGSTFTECCVPKSLANDNFNNNNHKKRSKEDDERIFAFICNIGDALQMVSHGKYISRTHRARNPNLSRGDGGGGGNVGDDAQHAKVCCCQDCRISLPLFVEPSPHRWPLS